jgi:hypothetical protein
MTVMSDREGRGCDERCYNAKRLGCSCICGVKNHGLGLKYALESSGGHFEEVEEEAEDEDEDEE